MDNTIENNSMMNIDDAIEHVMCENELSKTNRILRGIRSINQMITHVKSEKELFKKACAIAVKDINYGLVWIGMLDQESHCLTTADFATDSYDLFLSAPDIPDISNTNTDAMAKTVRTGQSQIVESLLDNPLKWSWQSLTLQAGYKTVCLIPLKKADKMIGISAFFPPKEEFFDTEEVSLIEEICSDISFAIGHLRQLKQEAALQKALAESEEKYRTMMEAISDAVCICSADFCIEYMNQNMIKRVGGDKVGKPCHDVLHGLKEKCPWCVHEKVMAGETIIYEITSPKDKKIYQISNSPIYHTDGSISKLSIYRDITEKKAVETRLQQAHKMEAIGTLAGGIAHDFNNILGVIIGYTELAMLDAEPGKAFAKNLTNVLNAGNRAKELVQQILSFSRQTKANYSPLKLQPLVKETVKMLRASIPATIDIITDIDKKCGSVMADPVQIHQILMNLCTNANHAMQESGGVLKIEIKRMVITADDPQQFTLNIQPGVYVELVVSDTGTGIDPKVIDRIFEPYFTTKGIGQGTGMGLAIVHGIIADYSGAISVKSDMGKGVAFHIFIPETDKDQLISNKRAKELPRGKEQILFIDDDKALAEMGHNMLERLGYTVTVMTSSIEALADFQNNPHGYDLVITDQTMPGMTGSELAKQMLQIRPDIPIILCTGYSNLIDKESAEDIGIKAFALKPLTHEDLAELTHKALNSVD